MMMHPLPLVPPHLPRLTKPNHQEATLAAIAVLAVGMMLELVEKKRKSRMRRISV